MFLPVVHALVIFLHSPRTNAMMLRGEAVKQAGYVAK